MKLGRKTVKRRALRAALLMSNAAILAAILLFVLQGPKTQGIRGPVLSSDPKPAVANPVDQVSSADIALTVARMGSLPETTAINNQAQSQAVDVALISSTSLLNKPQVVATALKSSADIKEYTVVTGDSVPIIATRFGVTSESIRWSNNLSGDSLTVGAKLSIPPVNGIVYTVNSGDTPDSLASRFNANKGKIIAYNDAEIKGLIVGQKIIIPDAVKTVAAPRASAVSLGAFAWGTTAIYGSNGYDYGYCTWYAANRVPVPSNWGNANTWAIYAAAGGWNVSRTPVKGAVAQTSAGYFGHVAVVEDVSADGTMIKYSDMNGLAGWGRVGTTPDWVPASHFQHFIYR